MDQKKGQITVTVGDKKVFLLSSCELKAAAPLAPAFGRGRKVRTKQRGVKMTKKRFIKLVMRGKPFAINRNQAIILARAANMCGLTYEDAYMKLLWLADDIQKDVVRAYDRYTLASIRDGVNAQCVTIEIPIEEDE